MVPMLYEMVDQRWLSTFSFTSGVTPFASLSSVVSALLLYALAVYGVKDAVRVRGKPFDLRRLCIGYNAALSVMSAYLLLHHCSVMSSLLQRHSLWSLLCDEAVQHTVGVKTFSLYVVYLTKFLELSDTLLLCLRGKPTPFIHLYHHAVTVVFAWLHLTQQTCLGWTMPILNLAVHVVLYAYFALHEMGVRVWWKRYLTLMQVTQFYLIMIPTFAALTPKLIFAVSPSLPLAHNVRVTADTEC